MHCTHIIVGGGMSGCVVALALAAWRKGARVAICEPGRLGGNFGTGGLQYLRDSEGMRALLDAHRISYGVRPVHGGVLTHKGRVLAYPDGLGGHLPEAQRLHYIKTRGTADGFVPGVMNFGGGGNTLVCDLQQLLGVVERVADIYQSAARVISGPMVSVGRWLEASEDIVSTVPLPVLANILQLDAKERPTCTGEQLRIGHIPLTDANRALAHYDYTYTPWLAAVHRVRGASPEALELEWNARNDGGVQADLQKLGGELITEPRTMPGHLHPVAWGTWRPEPPIKLAGRFAEWEPRMTVDQVADRWHKDLTR